MRLRGGATACGWTALFSGPTVEEKSTLYANRSTGFDYVRLGLAMSIAFWHGF